MSALRPRILVVDDQPQIHRFLTLALTAGGYDPVSALDGAEVLKQIAMRPPDAVVLDLGLPDQDGHAVLAAARQIYDGPALILSARDREAEKIAALDADADDDLEKPFGIGEFMARLRVALRHALLRRAEAPVVEAGAVVVDLERRQVTRDGQPVRLSPREYELLAALALGGGRVLTHRQLLTAVWGPAHVHDVQYLRVFIAQLRQKLEVDPARPQILLTEPGVGYRFMAS